MRILVLEDEFLLADLLSQEIRRLGDTVIGPFADIDGAMRGLVRADAAILDVGLGDRTSFEVADQLTRNDQPFVFLTGGARAAVPPRFLSQPVHSKPGQTRALLADLHGRRLRTRIGGTARDVLADMLSYARMLIADTAAAERLVERVMIQAIAAVMNGAPMPDLRGMMVALLEREIAQSLPRHLH